MSNGNDMETALNLICTKKEAKQILDMLRSQGNKWEQIDDDTYMSDKLNKEK